MKKLGVGLVMVVLGCGGGSSDVPLNQLAQSLSNTICKQDFACCDPTELAGMTMSDCVSSNEFAGGILAGSIMDSQTKGRVSYDAKQMGICLKEVGGLSCGDWKSGKKPTSRPSCTAAVTAKVDVGGACQQDFECTSGSCAGATTDGAGNPVDGACMAAPTTIAVGAACGSTSGVCEDGAYCDFTSQTCKAKKAAGETCATSDECANSCDSATSTCTCLVTVGCGVAAPATTHGSVLSLAVLGLAIAGSRLRRRRR